MTYGREVRDIAVLFCIYMCVCVCVCVGGGGGGVGVRVCVCVSVRSGTALTDAVVYQEN